MKPLAVAALCFAALVGSHSPVAAAPAASTASAAEIQRRPNAETRGTAAFVRVGDVPLVFTGQIAAAEGAGDVATEADRALAALARVLEQSGASLTRVIRLNACAVDDAAVATVEAAIAKRFAEAPPAFTLVRSPVAAAGVRVAFDAVATTARTPATVEVVSTQAAVLPAGAKLFISGQAERGSDVASSVKLTMAGLHRSLAHLGLKKSDVVQVKAFIQPFADHAAAAREIAASFDGGPVPAIVLVEWVSNLFTEIELVASARALPPPAGDQIVHAPLPWLTKSTRYSHIAHVAAGAPLIFVGAIDGGAGEGRAQMKAIFERLGSTLFEAGSSYRNLAKATYYFSDRSARAVLNDIRDVYYDPARPPAASAIDVKAPAHAGRGAMLDMIAVPLK